MCMIWSQPFLVMSASLSHLNRYFPSCPLPIFFSQTKLLSFLKTLCLFEHIIPYIICYLGLNGFSLNLILNLFNLFSLQFRLRCPFFWKTLTICTPESEWVAPVICPVSDYVPISILFFHCLYTGLDFLSIKHNLCLLKDSLVIHSYTCSIYHCA